MVKEVRYVRRVPQSRRGTLQVPQRGRLAATWMYMGQHPDPVITRFVAILLPALLGIDLSAFGITVADDATGIGFLDDPAILGEIPAGMLLTLFIVYFLVRLFFARKRIRSYRYLR